MLKFLQRVDKRCSWDPPMSKYNCWYSNLLGITAKFHQLLSCMQGYSNRSVIPTIKLISPRYYMWSLAREWHCWWMSTGLLDSQKLCYIWSIPWLLEFPLHEILSEYPALPYEVKRLETFSIIILLIKTNTFCRRLWCFWFLSYTLWWLEWSSSLL